MPGKFPARPDDFVKGQEQPEVAVAAPRVDFFNGLRFTQFAFPEGLPNLIAKIVGDEGSLHPA